MTEQTGPLRILHMVSSERWTGAADPAATLARQQQIQGHQVQFACIGGASVQRKLGEMGIPYVPGFHFDRRLNPTHMREDIALLRRYLTQNPTDVIHCHLPHDHWTAALALRLPLTRLARRARPAIVRTMHRQTSPRSDLPHRWLVGKGSDMIICISQSQRQKLIEGVGLPPSRSVWVRGCVDVERFCPDLSPEPIRQEYKIPLDARVAGLVARMQRHRGHHVLIDAVDQVAAQVPQAVLVTSGRGELKYEIIDRIKKHPYRKNLRRIGYRKDDLPMLYAALDVGVLLVPGSDGSCRAMLEMMACGRPVIGSRIGAIADAIEPGVSGWLIKPGDRHELAQALIEALSDPERTAQMGQAAREYIMKHHTPQAQQQAVDEVYAQALQRRGK